MGFLFWCNPWHLVDCDIRNNMADNLFDMLVFVRLVDAGSLSAAARELNLSLAVISRKLSRLEERLGVRRQCRR